MAHLPPHVPVHSLPVEIMRHIFSIIYNSFQIPERAGCTILLASVCRPWRNLALVHQELWNTFDAGYSPKYRALTLSRLASTHTSIDVIIPAEVPFSANEEFLLPPRGRWNSLHLTCTPLSPSWVLFMQLAPGLHELGNLTLDMDAEDPDTAAQISFPSLLPNLHTLHIVNIPSSIIWTPLTPKLINLRLDVIISDRGLRTIFAQCPLLESLSINLVVSNKGGSLEAGGWSNKPLNPPLSLRSLAFHQISSEYLCHLVKYLRAPALENLVLCTMHGSLATPVCAGDIHHNIYHQFFANLPHLGRLTIRCVAVILRALLKGIICAVSATDDSARAPNLIVGAFPRARFGSLSELSVASAKYDHPGILPPAQLSSSHHHHAFKEDLRVLLRELRVRNETGMEQHENSRKILRMLQLSGCSLEEDEITELQSYTWDLRIEA